MADVMGLVNMDKIKEKMLDKRFALEAELEEAQIAYFDGLQNGMDYMRRKAESMMQKMENAAVGAIRSAEEAKIKTIGVAAWEKDENGKIICRHCGGEAWARDKFQMNEEKQAPSLHCPWCGFQMTGNI